jgi:hypothetical protein
MTEKAEKEKEEEKDSTRGTEQERDRGGEGARETKIKKMSEKANYMDDGTGRKKRMEDDQEKWSGELENTEKGTAKGKMKNQRENIR